MPFILMLFLVPFAFGAHVSTGFYKSLLDVQDKNGKEERTPLNPMIGLGGNWRISEDWGFSPQINYIYTLRSSKDNYNDYKIHTFSILYDFIWTPFDSLKSQLGLRLGLGTFIKRISGEGGAVSVPNGTSGSSTAYRPDETQTSYTSTVNLGGEYLLNAFRGTFDNFGVRLETYTYRVLSGEHRSHAFSLTAVGYF